MDIKSNIFEDYMKLIESRKRELKPHVKKNPVNAELYITLDNNKKLMKTLYEHSDTSSPKAIIATKMSEDNTPYDFLEGFYTAVHHIGKTLMSKLDTMSNETKSLIMNIVNMYIPVGGKPSELFKEAESFRVRGTVDSINESGNIEKEKMVDRLPKLIANNHGIFKGGIVLVPHKIVTAPDLDTLYRKCDKEQVELQKKLIDFGKKNKVDLINCSVESLPLGGFFSMSSNDASEFKISGKEDNADVLEGILSSITMAVNKKTKSDETLKLDELE